jgi:hypothetical protein
VLANCGELGLDPEAISLSGYSEAVEVRNEPDDGRPEPSDWLRQRVNGTIN